MDTSKMTREEIRIQSVKFQNAYYNMLKGYTITDVLMEENMEFPSGDLWPSLLLRNKEGKTLEIRINQDTEGNGSGHIEYLGGEWPTEEETKATPAILWRGTEIGDGKIELKAIDIETNTVLTADEYGLKE